MICLHIVKWLQVLLFNTNYSIPHYSLVCKQCGPGSYGNEWLLHIPQIPVLLNPHHL